MRPALLFAAALLLCAGLLFAQSLPGTIGVYADEAGTACNFVDDPRMVQVHMLHVHTNGATASQFKLDVPITYWVHMGDDWAFDLWIGSSTTGVAIAYQTCLTGSIYLGLAHFFRLGSSAPPCTEILIVPYPDHENVRAVDCDETMMHPTGGIGYINPDPSCRCSVPVEETTWGGIKALYR